MNPRLSRRFGRSSTRTGGIEPRDRFSLLDGSPGALPARERELYDDEAVSHRGCDLRGVGLNHATMSFASSVTIPYVGYRSLPVSDSSSRAYALPKKGLGLCFTLYKPHDRVLEP